jgi:hypothetical protein
MNTHDLMMMSFRLGCRGVVSLEELIERLFL